MLNKSTVLSERAIKHNDLDWNIIPIGVAIVNNEEKEIGWYLNDTNISDNFLETIPSTSLLVVGEVGSGRSKANDLIFSHIEKFKNNFQLIGADATSEYTLHHSEFDGIVRDIFGISYTSQVVRSIMMNRFSILEQNSINNIYKLDSSVKVPYFELDGKEYQFDTVFSVAIDLDENNKNYEKLKKIADERWYDNKYHIIMTVESIYKNLKDETIKNVKIGDKTITLNDIKPIEDNNYKPKAIMFMISDLDEIMLSNDYKSIDIIKSSISSIIRLGRAVGIHIVLSSKKISDSIISKDTLENIQLKLLLGGFTSNTSEFLLGEDFSTECMPHIKGRGYLQTGNTTFEMQMYTGQIVLF